jgi:hypothetical protein
VSDEDPPGGRHEEDALVGAILRTEIAHFRDRSIYRYHPIEALPWSYWKSRCDLVAMQALAWTCDVPVFGRVVPSRDELVRICDGNSFPMLLSEARDFYVQGWHPDPIFLPDLEHMLYWQHESARRWIETYEFPKHLAAAWEKRNSARRRTEDAPPENSA